jgi:hypothetical protein
MLLSSWLGILVLSATFPAPEAVRGCACPAPSFGPGPASFAAGLATNAAVVGDFTGDGILDLVVANDSFTGELSVLVGTGTGNFGPPTTIPSGAEGGIDIVAADFNRDGRLDVAVVGMYGGDLSVLPASGPGTFAPPFTYFVGIQPASLVTADFNRDGWPDIAVANYASDTAVLLNHRDGTFEPPAFLPPGFGGARLLTADWNEDGIPDLAASQQGSNEIWLRLGVGDGSFGPLLVVTAPGAPYTLRTADIDEDGHLDLVMGHGSAAQVLLLRGHGDGQFDAPVSFPALDLVYDLDLGDVDQDGHLDLIASHIQGLTGTLSFMRGTGAGAFLPAVPRAPGLRGRVTLSDVDADGHLDVLAVERSDSAVVVLRGRGDGTFDEAPRSGAGDGPLALGLGDFNADGRADLAVADFDGNLVSILLGDGAGGFSPAGSYPVAAGPNSIAVADLDGDGRLDLAVNCNYASAVTILRGAGGGAFTPGQVLTAGLNLTSVTVGDFDEDGFPDLVATDSVAPGPGVLVFLGNGDGTFGTPTAFALTGDAPNAVAAADLDGDGHLDLAIANLFSFDVEVLLGDGTGVFGTGVRFPTSPNPDGLAVGDLNEDGHLDLAVASEGGSLLLGTGMGGFLPATSLGLPHSPKSILAVDLNGDGHRDLVSVDLTRNRTAVTLGRGDGTFLPPATWLLGGLTGTLATADVDGDGRTDVVVASKATDDVAILGNTSCLARRLRLVNDVAGPASTGLPFPGQPSLEVRDDGDNPVACASGSVGAVLVPGSGTPGALLQGSTSVPVVLGQAVFSDLAVDRPGEAYRLEFSNPLAGTKRSRAFDVAPSSLAIGDASVTEGNSGIVNADFLVTLSGPTGLPVSVAYSTSTGTAQEGADFQPISGVLTFVPGATQGLLSVPVVGDTLPEPNEHFSVLLTAPSNAVLGASIGRGLIIDDDGGSFSLGEAIHGTDEVRTLPAGPAPGRLYLLSQRPRSSYEAVVEDSSPNLGGGNGPGLRRLSADLATVLQDSVPEGAGSARRLAWEHADASPEEGEYVEVRSLGCTTDCGADDVYRFRFRETSSFIPHFNNQGSQVTVLVLQNTGPLPVSGHAWFWGPTGALLASAPLSVPARGTATVATATVPGLAGQSGSVTLSHDGGYGALTGKAVALEPATGFTFDTPLLPRAK